MGVGRMRKGWVVALCVVVSVALVGAALLSLAQLLRGILASEALREALGSLPVAPGSGAACALRQMAAL